MARTHKDVEFHVDKENRNVPSTIFSDFDKAAGLAVALAANSGESVLIDVVIWSRNGAYSYGGDDAASQYDEDPDASVFDRVIVRAESQGRVR